MTFDNVKIRCSSLSKVMGKTGLGKTGEKYLAEILASVKYGRSRELVTKYTQKGLLVEEDSFTLVSRVHKRFFTKNETNFTNDYITGTPDVVDGKIIRDTKSSWDIITFLGMTPKTAIDTYEWQLQGYMWLTDAETSFLDYALVNTPIALIEKEKRYKAYEMGSDPNNPSPECQQAWEEIERLSVYDDIPLSERIRTIEVKRDDAKIEQIKNRVIVCREFMNKTWGSNNEMV